MMEFGKVVPASLPRNHVPDARTVKLQYARNPSKVNPSVVEKTSPRGLPLPQHYPQLRVITFRIRFLSEEVRMKRQVGTFLLVTVIGVIFAQTSIAKEASAILKQHERNSISLELEFSKKNQNPLQRVISFLNCGPNGYATGFLVGGRLVLTAYHVVSGDLDPSKNLPLGF